jgi:hypothetical protein
MILTKLNIFYLMLLQRIPPAPSATAKAGTTPPGEVVPLDTNVWILLIIAVILIAYAAVPRLKKTA